MVLEGLVVTDSTCWGRGDAFKIDLWHSWHTRHGVSGCFRAGNSSPATGCNSCIYCITQCCVLVFHREMLAVFYRWQVYSRYYCQVAEQVADLLPAAHIDLGHKIWENPGLPKKHNYISDLCSGLDYYTGLTVHSNCATYPLHLHCKNPCSRTRQMCH